MSGVGSEIPLGHGVIGVAARERTPIRIGHMTAEYAYGRAMRESASAQRASAACSRPRFRCPGWPTSAQPARGADRRRRRSCSACCMWRARRTCASPTTTRTRWSLLAAQLGMAIRALQETADGEDERRCPVAVGAAEAGRAASSVRHYGADDSVFLDDDYLIKGVAGAILRRLAARLPEGRAHRVHQPRAAARSVAAPARPRRQSRSASRAADHAASPNARRHCASRRPAAAGSACA